MPNNSNNIASLLEREKQIKINQAGAASRRATLDASSKKLSEAQESLTGKRNERAALVADLNSPERLESYRQANQDAHAALRVAYFNAYGRTPNNEEMQSLAERFKSGEISMSWIETQLSKTSEDIQLLNSARQANQVMRQFRTDMERASEMSSEIESAEAELQGAQAEHDAAAADLAAYESSHQLVSPFEGLTDEDLEFIKQHAVMYAEILDSQYENFNANSGVLISNYTNRNNADSRLVDIRNLPSNKNFRTFYNTKLDSNNMDLKTPARSYFLTDYKFAESLTLVNDLQKEPKIPMLILNEFQPYESISPGDILNGLGEFISKVVLSMFGFAGEPILTGGGKLITNAFINKYAKNTRQIYTDAATRGGPKYFTSDPIKIIQNMFMAGRWLNTYEIPYFGGQYLKANYSQNWQLGDSAGFLGSGFSNMTKMMGIDFPSNPKFKADMSKGRENIEVEFYLLNTDNNWLKRNFQFLNAIYAGTNWLHLPYCFIRPPNVYHVECPGRFQIYWAAMDITVTFEGKLRRNEQVSNELHDFSNAITKDMLWPEAWKINITLRDLTPNNFNLYAEYYLHGMNAAELAAIDGSQLKNVQGTLQDLYDYFNGFFNDGEIKKLIDEGTSGVKELLESVKEKLKTIKDGGNLSKDDVLTALGIDPNKNGMESANAEINMEAVQSARIGGIQQSGGSAFRHMNQEKFDEIERESFRQRAAIYAELASTSGVAKHAREYWQGPEGQAVLRQVDETLTETRNGLEKTADNLLGGNK